MKKIAQTTTPSEKQIAATISTYLSTRGDKIASDLGLLTFREVGGALVAEVGGATYRVAIVVTSANDNDRAGRR